MNKDFFSSGEADAWFDRNRDQLDSSVHYRPISLITDWLTPFSEEINKLLEIGCGTGHRLDAMAQNLNAQGYGIEPSQKAVDYIAQRFPHLAVQHGFGDDIPFDQRFDLVHLGFFLYLVDRRLYLKCLAEADRLLRPGGFLSIIDFDTPTNYSNQYSHLDGVHSHKTNNCNALTSSGLYTLVNKHHYCHKHFHFNKEIDERLSVSLLYKETEIFS